MSKNIQFDRTAGGIIGFIIGDALGAPTAGLNQLEVKKTVGYVCKFTTNYRHPFFYYLKKGQYSSNSSLLISILEVLAEKKHYDHYFIRRKLKLLAKRAKKDFFYSRWFGPSTMQAILSGKPTENPSATCVYRSIPIALLYNNFEKILALSRRQSRITHISPISLASSDYICFILYRLNKGEKNIQTIAKTALKFIEKSYNNIDILTDKLHLVLNNKLSSIEKAKQILGTGPSAHMIIPISLYCVLRYPNNFSRGVVTAANCHRKHTQEERKRLAYLTYAQELIESRMGCTDSIAGLVGAILGVYHGYSKFPQKFISDLEDREKILKLISQFSFSA